MLFPKKLLHSLLGAQIGQKLDEMQWAFSLIGEHFFDSTEKENGVKTDVNSHNSYSGRVDFLNSIATNSFIRSFAEIAFTDKFNDENGFKTQQATDITLGAEYQYLMSQNLLLRAGVSYLNHENAVAGTVETVDDSQFNFLAGANYQF